MTQAIYTHVCIASYNTARATELTVRSALRRAGMPFQLIVGDGASTDGSLKMLQRFDDSGLLQLDVAPSARLHTEWLDHWYRTCTARYLVFSDSDVYYRRHGWLLDLVNTSRETGAALVAGRIQPHWTERPAFADGMQKRLPGARPEPCLMLIDMDQVRGVVQTSFAWYQEPIPDQPGQKLMFDVAGAFMRSAEQAGLKCIAMPDHFQSKYRHWGGLTWKKASSEEIGLRLRTRQLAKTGLVFVLLAAERSFDALGPQGAFRRRKGI